jgi:RNA polymerase sigma-70 factor (ECF subfamily)
MLHPVRSDTAAASASASTEAVARALAALTSSDLVRLKRLAQLRARLLPGLEWDELLNEALLRALDGSRRWPDGPEIDPAEAEEVRRLVMVQTARRRRNTLPAAWSRRPGIPPQIVPDAEPTPKATGPDEPTPRSPDRPVPLPPAWHE